MDDEKLERNYDLQARRFFKQLERSDEMGWRKYFLLRLFTLVLFNVIIMGVLALLIPNPVIRYLANVVNVAVLFMVSGLIKKKRGGKTINDARDLTRLIIRVFLQAGMPFLIAILSLLVGNDVVVYCGGEPVIRLMDLAMQLLLYGFAYGMMFAVMYALTSD
ncbi:MAG: hypothetical protein Q6365_008740 [Candidatus Sigynarchaeota archaeon]